MPDAHERATAAREALRWHVWGCAVCRKANGDTGGCLEGTRLTVKDDEASRAADRHALPH